LAQGGQVTGSLKTERGDPVPGIRVAATASPDDRGAAGMVFVSLSETDSEGRFTLENIPTGRYYIVAGRIEQPTYYPGTLDATKGTLVTINPGDRLTNINFVIAEPSTRVDSSRAVATKTHVTVPISVTIEGEETLPALAVAKLQLVPISGGANLEVPLNSDSVAIPLSRVREEYRVSVANLPDGYQVKSMRFGQADLSTDTLKPSFQSLPASLPLIVTFTGEGELQRIINGIVQRDNNPQTLTITLKRK